MLCRKSISGQSFRHISYFAVYVFGTVKGKGQEGTNDTGNTAVVDIHQVTVQIHVLLTPNLNCGVGCFVCKCAGWESHFGEESERGKVDRGVGFRGEVFFG